MLIPVEAEAIREAANRVLAGDTLSSIVTEWNRLGLRTSRGGPWRINSLSGLLLQERLTAPPAIIDGETRRRLLALHASRRKGS
ncbi:MAG: recombinase family protein, partial [Actinobacteria bacterium]|nr:recombinase family protein [Actinomycetota bacterium]